MDIAVKLGVIYRVSIYRCVPSKLMFALIKPSWMTGRKKGNVFPSPLKATRETDSTP